MDSFGVTQSILSIAGVATTLEMSSREPVP